MASMRSQVLNANLPRNGVSIKTLSMLKILWIFELGIRKCIWPCKILSQIIMTDLLSGRTHLEINPIPAPTNKHTYACMYVSLYIMLCVEFINLKKKYFTSLYVKVKKITM